jgi:hypothetical protein
MTSSIRITFPILLGIVAACGDAPTSAGGPVRPIEPSCPSPTRLALGEAAEVRITDGCPMRLAGGAEYALAFYDASLAEGARNGPEIYIPDGTYTVTVSDRSGTAPPSSASPAILPPSVPHGAEPPHFVISDATQPRRTIWPEHEGRPWREGDVITRSETVCAPTCLPPLTSRVARVYDGWLVFAVDESTLPAGEAERVVQLFDEAMPRVARHGIPLMRGALADALPTSEPGSGQLVVVFEGDVTAGGGTTFIETHPAGWARHWIRLEWSTDLDMGRMLWLLAHEIAHAYQGEFIARTPPLSGPGTLRGGARWGVEGGATLLENETIRGVVGASLTGNHDFHRPESSELERYFFRSAGAYAGNLTAGYFGGASFLRDAMLRRMEAGEPLDDALRDVSRGAMEGWYGLSLDGSRRPGLVGRMRGRIPAWDPVDAVLTWTLSAAGDDLTPNAVYQDRAWLRTWDAVGSPWAWPALGVVQGGSGASQTLTRPAGAPGYVLLRDPGSGVAFTVSSPAGVYWKLLRIR